jgi:hypothetical protein
MIPAMANRRSGNPAKKGWEPLEIGPAADTGTEIGMAAAFHATGGKQHWYNYREALQQPAVAILAFHNRQYNGFALVFKDTSMHLTFKRNDRAAVRDWRHFQAIKNEVAGPQREALEIYPPESELVDAANEYHLWVLPEGLTAPYGFQERALMDSASSHDHAQYRQTGKAGYRQREWEEGIPTGLGIPGTQPTITPNDKE